MSIYVSELPKKCEDCGFCKNNHCLFDTADCPFVKTDIITFYSLADYTKQVRKEVVQELKDKMLYCSERFADGCHYYNGKELDEIIDQIQGELVLPTWEEFDKKCYFEFVSADGTKLVLEKTLTVDCDREPISYYVLKILVNDYDHRLLFESEYTKENYTLACRKCKELFLGGSDEQI